MPKNRDVSAIFASNRVSLLIDTSSIVRIRNFSEAIPYYAKFFDLYTLEKNKSELTFLADDPLKSSFMLSYSLELIKQIQEGNIKTLRNGAPYVAMPKSFDRKICKKFPNNELSYTDKLLLFFTSSSKESTILVTNDRELHDIAEELGIVSFGAYELFILMNKTEIAPKNVKELLPAIAETKNTIKMASHSQ